LPHVTFHKDGFHRFEKKRVETGNRFIPRRRRSQLDTAINRPDAPARGAGFQTCCIAGFPPSRRAKAPLRRDGGQAGKALGITRFAGFETRDQPRTPSGYTDLSVSASLRRDRAEAGGEGGEVCATGSGCAAAGNCTTMGGDHAQSRQSTAMEYSRPGPDFGATHIKYSG